MLIATPGPPASTSWTSGAAHLSDVEVLVLDEADRMLDMGFWPTMQARSSAATPHDRQTLLFSRHHRPHPVMNSIAASCCAIPRSSRSPTRARPADTVEQYVIPCAAERRSPSCSSAVLDENAARKRVIVFCRTRSRARRHRAAA